MSIMSLIIPCSKTSTCGTALHQHFCEGIAIVHSFKTYCPNLNQESDQWHSQWVADFFQFILVLFGMVGHRFLGMKYIFVVWVGMFYQLHLGL